MANPYQDALFESMEYLLKDRVNKLDRDKTITATIVLCVNALTGEYKVNYNNGFITAYAEGASYSPNQTVYVLVPEGDFTKRKIIVGRASTLEGDNNITFVSSMLNDYNVIGDNVISDKNNLYPIGLHSYLKEDYLVLYDKDLVNDEDAKVKILSLDVDKLNNYIKEAEAIMIEATFQTRLPKEHRSAKEGIYGIQFLLAFQDQAEPTKERLYTYTLDTNNMTGNPFLYQNEMDQYAIFPIDVENFKRIESIMVFSRGFVSEDDPRQDALWGADIFIKDVEFYGLRPIDAQQGDYRLKITTPMGATFKTTSKDETLEAYGLVTYQINEEISDTTSYYWFSKDDRVSSASEGYQMYGGSGWRYLKAKGNTKHLVTNGSENRAYENKYLCVAVYKDMVILKSYFTLYNEAAKRDISIVSNLGVSFCFDRGTPVLTCLVNGKENNFEEAHHDDLFSFSWSKINQDGSTVVFNRSYEDIKEEYEELMKTFDKSKVEGSEDSNTTLYSTIVRLRNEMAQMEDVVIKGDRGNILEHPVKNISSSVTFSCSVYLKDTDDGNDYFIGNATITLVNEGAAKPSDYYILIENGQQVFQYSESGVSPASERYTDPQEILPLGCKFFDPAGLEINPDTYSVRWRIPIEYTMIDSSEETLSVNPANSIPEYFYGKNYKLKIAENFDYDCVLNQIECIITYKGQEYTRYTDFLFVKVGDNGTNGTDFVCKIVPKSNVGEKLNNEPLVLQYNSSGSASFNNGVSVSVTSQYFAETSIEFQLFNRGTRVMDLGSVNWSIAGSQAYAKYLSIQSDTGAVSWDITKVPARNPKTNLIIKASTNYNISGVKQTFYCYYPLPVVNYMSQDISNIGSDRQVHFDEQYRLKQVLYNAEGRNPLFDKNQGLVFHIGNGKNKDYYAILSARGGYNDNVSNAAFTLSEDRDDNEGASGNIRISPDKSTGEFKCYVVPNDIYTGEFCNNRIHGDIYTNSGGKVLEFEVPIHFMLNVYGHASLNAWDGNHVEINEDENYVLAPQIGAGIKNDENKFTGILMGEVKTYTGNKVYGENHCVGLLGYAQGRQSIWLDAETGNATFGLPEQQAFGDNENTPQLEGRIELRPTGTSKIGSWKLGAKALYNSKNSVGGDIDIVTRGPSSASSSFNWGPPSGADIFIGKNNKGIILSADPAYLSIKTSSLSSSDIETDDANNLVEAGDSIEIELDPNRMSAITIYRHFYKGSSWVRESLAGINRNGEFYSNALEHANTSLGLGFIGALNHKASEKRFVGSRLGTSASTGGRVTNIVKFFVPAINTGDKPSISDSSILYISGATSVSDEYQRPIIIMGDYLNLEANGSSTEKGSHRIHIGNDGFYAGNASGSSGSFFDLKESGGSSLRVSGEFTETYQGKVTSNLEKDLELTINGTTKETHKGRVEERYSAEVKDYYSGNLQQNFTNSSSTWNIRGMGTARIGVGSFSEGSESENITTLLQLDKGKALLKTTDGTNNARVSSLQLSPTSTSELTTAEGFKLTNKNKEVRVTTNGALGIAIETISSTNVKSILSLATGSPGSWFLGNQNSSGTAVDKGGSISFTPPSRADDEYQVRIAPNLFVGNNIKMGGDLALNGNLEMVNGGKGEIHANGIKIEGSSYLFGDTFLSGKGGNVYVGSSDNPGNAADLKIVKGDLRVENFASESYFAGTVQFDKTITVTETVSVNGGIGVGKTWIDTNNVSVPGADLKGAKDRADSAYDLAATKTTMGDVQKWVNDQGFLTSSALSGLPSKPNGVTANAGTILLHYKGNTGDNREASVANATTATVANACAQAINSMR